MEFLTNLVGIWHFRPETTSHLHKPFILGWCNLGAVSDNYIWELSNASAVEDGLKDHSLNREDGKVIYIINNNDTDTAAVITTPTLHTSYFLCSVEFW